MIDHRTYCVEDLAHPLLTRGVRGPRSVSGGLTLGSSSPTRHHSILGPHDPIPSQIGDLRPRATMTEKQLGNSVVHGRQITFAITGNDSITGYLGGLDNDSFLVLVAEKGGVRPHLICRRSSPFQELHPASTLSEELHLTSLEAVLTPFRKWVRESLLGNTTKSR